MTQSKENSTTNKAIALSMALLFIAMLSINVIAGEKAKSSKAKPTGSLRFALSDQHGFPDNESKDYFDCLDKIYAVTELNHFSKGKYAIEFRWIAPNGKVRERTKYDFFVRDQPTTKLWAWLELSRAKGAGMIQWLNPAAGLEEFIGLWELELLINDQKLNKGEFEVNC